MSSALLNLRSKDAANRHSEVVIDPAEGARINRYTCIDNQGCAHDWFMPAVNGDGGCFVMVPFCSRVQKGQFIFANQTVKLDVSQAADAHAIHGHGLHQHWRVTEQAESRVALEYAYAAADWPWSYRVTMIVQLQGLQLHIQLVVDNLAANEMPLGVGLHPYFPLDGQTRVQAEVAQHLILDPELMPTSVRSMPGELDLAHGIAPEQLALDDVFLGWRREARLLWPNRQCSLRISATAPCEHLVVWSPRDARFVCVEPVSNVPNGFNTKLGIQPRYQVLGPGGQLTVRWIFEPEFEPLG